ncbi:MAG: LamG domain-containing protein [Planctomycetes bacterium]|nr:LamG domain-containing protein [Planctomycetota bacterium]
MKTLLCSGIVLLAFAGRADAAPASFANEVQTSQPVLWYRFNEASGAIINHGSLGAGYNATTFNGVIYSEPTSGGDTGVRFNASTQPYIESLNAVPASLTGNPTFSAEAIVRIDSQGALWAPMLWWGTNPTGTSVWFSIQGNNYDRFFAGFYNSGLRTVCRTKQSVWYHVVWTRDSNNGTNNSLTGTKFYINGQLAEMTRDESLLGAVPVNVASSKFRIQKAADFTRFFTGGLDELALYQRVLSAEEVQAHAATLGFGIEAKFCPADFNNDCLVDDLDFTSFVTGYNLLVCEDAAMPFGCPADLNDDDLVDDADFIIFVNAYNTLACE